MIDANSQRRRGPFDAPTASAQRPPGKAPRRARRQDLVAALALLAALLGVIGAMPPGAAATAGPDPGIIPRAGRRVAVSREVYGYLPYWRVDAGTTQRLDYATLSTIAFFAVPIKSGGALDTSAPGYDAYVSPAAAAVTNEAHARGIRVVPTFQLFDSGSLSTVRTFLQSRRAQARFIAAALDLMVRRRADGANLDVEPVPDALAPSFAEFVARFSAAVHRRVPGGQVVVALGASEPDAAIGAIGRAADRIFIMGYDYHWQGSTTPGPVAPLRTGPQTVADTVSRYALQVPVRKLILGVPAYGYSWPVVASAPGSPVQANLARYGGVRSVTLESALAFLAAHPRIVRHVTPDGSWFRYWDAAAKTWREVHFEDAASMRAKFRFAIARGLAGVGLWTLDSDTRRLLAASIRSTFVTPVRRMAVMASVAGVRAPGGSVLVDTAVTLRNTGAIPERGVLALQIVDSGGRTVRTVRRLVTVPAGALVRIAAATPIGAAWARAAGAYRMLARLETPGRRWSGPTVGFLQPF
jgi:spore germination protein YaaH